MDREHGTNNTTAVMECVAMNMEKCACGQMAVRAEVSRASGKWFFRCEKCWNEGHSTTMWQHHQPEGFVKEDGTALSEQIADLDSAQMDKELEADGVY